MALLTRFDRGLAISSVRLTISFGFVAVYALFSRKEAQFTTRRSVRSSVTLPRCFCIASQGFLAFLHIAHLFTAAKSGHHQSDSTTGLIYESASIASLGACLLAIHALLRSSQRCLRLIYFLSMAAVEAAELHAGSGQSEMFTLASMAAYTGSFLADLSFSILPSTDSENTALDLWSQRTVFDKCTFAWLDPLVQMGSTAPLRLEDLPIIPASLKRAIDPDKSTSISEPTGRLPGLLAMMMIHCRGEYFVSLFFELLDIACKFSMPWVLKGFLNDARPLTAVVFTILGIVNTVATTQAALHLKLAGATIRIMLVSKVHDHLLSLPLDTESTHPSPVNLVEVDAQSVQDCAQFVHATWSAPMQIILCLSGIALILGRAGAAAALAVLLLFIPAMHALNLRQHRFQTQYMERRDGRLSTTSEIVRNIFHVKVRGITSVMEGRANEARRGELEISEKMNWVTAGINVILRTAPTISSVAAFGATVMTGKELHVDTLFSALLLFGLLVYPLSLLPSVVISWAAYKVSLTRLRKFFGQPARIDHQRPGHDGREPTVDFQSVSYVWNARGGVCGIAGINLSVTKSGLVTVDGPTGSGKSAFLSLCAGAIGRYGGDITTNGTVAFVPQVTWLQTGSLRSNILFGTEYNPAFYGQVVKACALEQDLKLLSRGDETAIDSLGSGLSGGQKTRIMLARAVYSRADIYLLDDPLSALDSKTKSWIVSHVLGPCGILKNKVRIVTSSAAYLQHLAHQSFIISGGHLVPEPHHEPPDAALDNSRPNENIRQNLDIECYKDMATPEQSDASLAIASVDDSAAKPHSETDRAPGGGEGVMRNFGSGQVNGSDLYRRFIAYGGYRSWLVVTLTIATSYAANTMSAYMLRCMSFDPENASYYWMVLYALCCAAQSALIFAWLKLGWFLCNLPTSLRIHADLVHAVLVSPMGFFRAASVGEILNRFTNDLSRIDSPLFGLIYGFLNAAIRTLATLILVTTSSPVSLTFIIPLLVLFALLHRRYVYIAVQLSKFERETRGPVISGIEEATTGRVVITAFKKEQRAKEQHRSRLLQHLGAYFSAFSLQQWLVFRAGILAAITSGLCPAALIYMGTDLATVGLVMSFVLQLSSSLSVTATTSTQIESEMVSFSRIQEFCSIVPEGVGAKTRMPPPASWPARGVIEIDAVWASYDRASGPVLRNVSLNIPSGQRIGIVGRSGAGKSSISSILLGLLDIEQGSVRIDGINIAELNLEDLRQRIMTITQEPVAFSGTVRENLDPNNDFDTTDLIRAINDSHFASGFLDAQQALDSYLVDGGTNISTGQLQLLAIARCLLHPSSILILDEATASVDVTTECIILETLRKHFQHRTVITLAHRLQAIVDCDVVIVMHAGQIREMGRPKELYEQGIVFRQLVEEADMRETFRQT